MYILGISDYDKRRFCLRYYDIYRDVYSHQSWNIDLRRQQKHDTIIPTSIRLLFYHDQNMVRVTTQSFVLQDT